MNIIDKINQKQINPNIKVCYDIDKAKSYLVAGEGYTANAGVDCSSANITYSAN